MKTYQDFLECTGSEAETGRFLLSAVNDFRGEPEYKSAITAMRYYSKHNETIEKFQKWLYTVTGRQVPDLFSSNYKLKSLIFRRLVIQQVQYILANGLMMDGKEKLGKNIDIKLQEAAKMALVQGKAFGFWNANHLEIFTLADYNGVPGFLPLLDESTSEMMAGVRFWFRDVAGKQVLRATLYELDGVSEWVKGSEDDVPKLMQPKRGYIRTVSKDSTGIVDICEENYTRLPIAVLYGSDTKESELVGIRESIDCYDFIKSGFANDIDDASGFYWLIKNAGGMEDKDLAQFIQRMKTVHAAVVDGDEGISAEAHTMEIPYEARERALKLLRDDIYADFQALDSKALTASQLTATAINTAYQGQDNKCGDFEAYILDFVQQLCDIVGVDSSTASFKWNKIVNELEQTQMVMMAANYMDDESILKHLPFLMPEEVDSILRHRDTTDMQRFSMGGIQQPEV